MVVSTDSENPSDVLAMTGASAALHLSDIPWAGPYAGVRVGRIDGEFVVNPTFAERAEVGARPVVAASRDAIVMVEGGAAEVAEDVIIDALMFAHKAAQPLIDLQEKLRAAVGKPKRVFVPPVKDPAIVEPRRGRSPTRRSRRPWRSATSRSATPRSDAVGQRDRRGAHGRRVRRAASARGRARPFESAQEEAPARAGARHRRAASTAAPPADIRAITCEVGRPAAHPRLGAVHARRDPGAGHDHARHQRRTRSTSTALIGDVEKRFMLHYNFPPFSTGEAKPLRGASRREIGHGHLAERALSRVLPPRRTSPTRSASSRRSSSRTAARRWPRSAAARCR